MISIALIRPEIPQNTGNIARLTVAIGAELIVVGPTGFDMSDAAVRRAGLDYWKDVTLVVCRDFREFESRCGGRRWVGVDPKGETSYRDFDYRDEDILIFGCESTGLDFLPKESIHIPMARECRSINLSNAVAIVAYEAINGGKRFVN